MSIDVATHPLLDLVAFRATLGAPLAAPGDAPPWDADALTALLGPIEEGATTTDPESATRVRDLLRHGGFKPAGRSKPCSEYLAKAVPEGRLPRINLAVDLCNALVFATGLPASVLDLDKLTAPLAVRVAGDEPYVFNASGQVIDVRGLLCLFDAAGPCANAVKDSQRTKTGPGTTRTLCVVWGTNREPGRAAAAGAWWRRALVAHGATVEAA